LLYALTKVVWWEAPGKSTGAFQALYEVLLALRAADAVYARNSLMAARSTSDQDAGLQQLAWHSLFIRQLLIRAGRTGARGLRPEFTHRDLPSFKADPAPRRALGHIIAIDFTRRSSDRQLVYAGEIKKSVFTALNFYLPRRA